MDLKNIELMIRHLRFVLKDHLLANYLKVKVNFDFLNQRMIKLFDFSSSLIAC